MVGERYNVNIGEVDDAESAMRRNIVHLLCLQPMSHSELVKLLPEDVCSASYVTLLSHFSPECGSIL